VICYAQALDRVVAEAGRHEVRLILSLANSLEAFGGKTQYVRWAWEEGVGLSASNDSFFFDPAVRDYFKVYLKVSSAGSSSSPARRFLTFTVTAQAAVSVNSGTVVTRHHGVCRWRAFFTDGAFAVGCRRC
jgi:hypothetical protein